MKKYKALIIGAGNIGAFFDSPNSDYIITHAHAYTTHIGFELVGFVDSDIIKAKKATEVWGGKYYSNIESAFKDLEKIDVVSVCVPDDFHYQTLKELSSKSIKLVFAEKPITKNVIEAEEVIKIFTNNKIELAVNYSRRYVPEFLELKKEIHNKKYGKFIFGNGIYGKGIMHNGSHLIDLIRMLVGEVNVVNKIKVQTDSYEDDPSVSAILNMTEGGLIVLQTINCNLYTIFELDLLFQKGRIRITDSGRLIEKYSAADSELFRNYKYLTKETEEETSIDKAINFAIDNIFNNMNGSDKLVCDGREAVLDLATAIKIKEKAVS